MTATAISPKRPTFPRPLPTGDLPSAAAKALPTRPSWLFDSAPAVSPQTQPPAPVVARKRVLVVDNEPAATRLVRLTLERSGLFEVCEINEPRRALAAAQSFQPNLVLLDIEMPGLDGSGVAAQLRADPALHKVPLLFITSLVTQAEADQNLFAAGSRVLAKPVTLAKLMQSVAEMLGDIVANGAAGQSPAS